MDAPLNAVSAVAKTTSLFVLLFMFPLLLSFQNRHLPCFVHRRGHHICSEARDMSGASLSDELALIDSPSSTELLTLNLRGTLFLVPTTAAMRLPASYLCRVLMGSATPVPHRDKNGCYYFNRNPTVFHAVLDAAASGEVMFPDSDTALRRLLDAELRFWGITPKRMREESGVRLEDRSTHAPRHYGAVEVVLSDSAKPAGGPSLMDISALKPPALGDRAAGIGFRSS
jgi:hypothetical protein